MNILFLPPIQNRKSSKSAALTILKTYSRINNIKKTILFDDFGEEISEDFKNLLNNFNVIKINSRGRLNIIKMFFHLLKISKNYDIIYNFSDYPPSSYFIYWLSKLSGVPFLTRVHHLDNNELNLLSKYMLKRVLIGSKYIFVSDNKVVIKSLENIVKNKEIMLFKTGIDVNSYYIDEKLYDCAFLGNLIERKGIYYLPEIWKKVVNNKNNAKLLIIGHGDKETTLKLKEMFNGFGIQDNVEFLGFIDDNKRNKILAKSKIFLFPSIKEGFGVVIAEAMASKAVPVIWNIGDFNRFKKGVVKIEYKNTDLYAEKILELLNNNNLRNKISDDGYSFIKTFSWDDVANLEISNINKIKLRENIN